MRCDGVGRDDVGSDGVCSDGVGSDGIESGNDGDGDLLAVAGNSSGCWSL